MRRRRNDLSISINPLLLLKLYNQDVVDLYTLPWSHTGRTVSVIVELAGLEEWNCQQLVS